MQFGNYLIGKLRKIGQNLTKGKTEPQINYKCDRKERCYWLVYDPISGYSTTLSSEQEVRIWLENRYYHC